MSIKLEIPNLDDLILNYAAGASLKRISDITGISRTALGRAFRERGVELRGQSDSERLKWAAMDVDARQRQVAAAHAAARGRVDRLSTKLARAKTRYERLLHRGHLEDDVGSALRRMGHQVDWQFPVGPYNVDVVMHECSIAVEISCGGGKATRRALAPKRTKYIVDAGWTVIFVEAPKRRGVPSTERIAERLHSLSQEVGRHHPGAGQYGVIGGHGDPLPGACPHFDHLARIPGL